MQITEVILKNSNLPVYIKQDENLKKGDRVVVNLSGSEELGIIGENIEHTGQEVVPFRPATAQDNKANCEACRYSRSLLAEIKQQAQALDLNMKIGHISCNLDRSKITVYYTADDRVDFRELIKVLGSKYKSRIEMKQVGNRDETKIIGAMGVCGRVTCCKAFLNDFDKVSIKMAKNQNISLNPNRINGMCGRLLCCLKYEDEFYEQMQKKMPKLNSTITTPDGKGVVTNLDFLKETITVTFTKDDSSETKIYSLEDYQAFKKKD